MQTAQEITRAQNQREVDLPHPLPQGQDRFKQSPTPGPEKLDLSRGSAPGEMVTGQIEPGITALGGSTSFGPLFTLSILTIIC